jgi:hypothetical protein
MRAEELWIEPDAGNPFRKESRVLPCRHALTEAASTWEEKFAPALAGGFQVIVDSVTGLIRRLELDRPTRLFLPNRCVIHRIAVSCNVLDLDSDDIAAAKLAVDGQIKRGEVAHSPL